MIDREKVIDYLKWAIAEAELTGHTSITLEPLKDALTLLKDQEPRVLEYSEIEKHPLVWLEDNDKEDVIPALFLQYNGWSAEFSVQAPDKYVDAIVRSAEVIADERKYGVTWRAWMAKPTNEQREAVKWDD